MRSHLVRALATVALVATLALTSVASLTALARPVAAARAAEAPTTVAGDEPGIGALDSGSNAPSPRGQPEPPRVQRVADTAIFVGLLGLFAAGVGVAVWSARRAPDGPGPVETSGPSGP